MEPSACDRSKLKAFTSRHPLPGKENPAVSAHGRYGLRRCSLRTFLLGSILLAILSLTGSSASADVVVLRSGARLTGTVESESDTEIMLRTEIGLMRFAKKLVEKIERDGTEPPRGARLAGSEAWRVEGVVPEVPPAFSGSHAIVARREGGLTALHATDGSTAWDSSAGGTMVTGLSADPGGVYVATVAGELIRVRVAEGPTRGRTMWSVSVRLPLVGAPLLHRRRLRPETSSGACSSESSTATGWQ